VQTDHAVARLSTISFMKVRSLRPESVWRSALNSLLKTRDLAVSLARLGLGRPQVPTFGWVKTAVGMKS
jgi:hypothetical protein